MQPPRPKRQFPQTRRTYAAVYLAAFGLLLGAGVAARVQLGQQLHG